jgi:hypothetical protein
MAAAIPNRSISAAELTAGDPARPNR